MSKHSKALKLALEALNELIPDVHDWYGAKVHRANAAITAIREALAEQPAQQKPVATVQDLDEVKRKHLVYELGFDWKDPLYTSPPASKPWVGLTRDERMSIINRLIGQDWVYALDAIEAKLKEKNA